MYLVSFFLLNVLRAVSAWDSCVSSVENRFCEANIPSDSQFTFKPSIIFDVTFEQSSGPPVCLTAEETLLVSQTAIPPLFIAAIDLDAPTPQNRSLSQIRHFLGGDFTVQLNSSATGNSVPLVNSTPAITEWLQPGPPNGSDPHRYVFFLFAQSAAFNQQTLVDGNTDRLSFNLSQFALEVGLGSPLGGSFMLVGPQT